MTINLAAAARAIPLTALMLAACVSEKTWQSRLSSSGSSDLWLENSAGVIMHLQGTSTGAMLTLGKDEIFVRMAQ